MSYNDSIYGKGVRPQFEAFIAGMEAAGKDVSLLRRVEREPINRSERDEIIKMMECEKLSDLPDISWAHPITLQRLHEVMHRCLNAEAEVERFNSSPAAEPQKQ